MIDKEELDVITAVMYHKIYSICMYNLNHVQDAEDATQRVFQIFTEKADNLEAEGIDKWLYKVAAYVLLNEYTKRQKNLQRNCPFDEESEELYKRASRFEDAYLDLHYEEFFEYAYETTAKNDKELFDLLSDGNIKEGKIAEHLNISNHACYMRKNRLKKRVKKKTSEKMIF